MRGLTVVLTNRQLTEWNEEGNRIPFVYTNVSQRNVMNMYALKIPEAGT